MRVHGVRMHNMARYGEKDNVVEFDKGAAEFLQAGDELLVWEREHMSKLASTFFPVWRDDAERRYMSIVGMTDGDPKKSNGSGKTTIPDAIAYAFFEKLPREFSRKEKDRDKGKSTVSITHHDGRSDKLAFSEVLFSDNSNLWLIRRGRLLKPGGKHTAVFSLNCVTSEEFVSGGTQSGRHGKDDEATLRELIGVSYETFSNSVLFGQYDSGQVLVGTDSVRKDVIMNALRLGIVDEYLRETRDRAKATRGEMDVIEAKMAIFEAKISSVSADDEALLVLLGAQVAASVKLIADLEAKIAEMRQSKEFEGLNSARTNMESARQTLLHKEVERDASIKATSGKVNMARASLEADQKAVGKATLDITTLDLEIGKLALKLANSGRKDVEKQLVVVEKAKAAKPEREKQLRQARSDERGAAEKRALLEKELSSKKAELAELNGLVTSMGLDAKIKCSKCKTLVGHEHLASEMRTISELVPVLEMDSKASSEQELVIVAAVADLEVRLKRIDEALGQEATLRSRLKDIDFDDERMKGLSERKLELNKTLSELKGKADSHQADLTALEAELTVAAAGFESGIQAARLAYEKLAEDVKSLDAAVASLRAALIGKDAELWAGRQLKDEKTAQMIRLQAQVDEAAAAKAAAIVLSAQLADKRKILTMLETLDRVYGSDGVKARIVEHYMPLLNSYLEDYSRVASGGAMGMRFETSPKDPSKIEIKITGDSAQSCELLSGGEFTRARLALDFSLGLLSFARSRNVIECVWIDEALASVDDVGKDAVFELLDKLGEFFRTIVIISHDRLLQERIPHTIVVNKVCGVSRIEKQFYEA